jgi:hypothetical protein
LGPDSCVGNNSRVRFLKKRLVTFGDRRVCSRNVPQCAVDRLRRKCATRHPVKHSWLLSVLLVACGAGARARAGAGAALPAQRNEPVLATPPRTKKLERATFNRQALLSALPLFWKADANGNGDLDPDELGVYWAPTLKAVKLADYVQANAFTEAYQSIYAGLANRKQAPSDASSEEIARLSAIEAELDQRAISFIETDLRGAPAAEKQFAATMLSVAEVIERLYARQLGTIDAKRFTDPASTALYFRNQSLRCLTKNPSCRLSADPSYQPFSGLYPLELLKIGKVCEVLSKSADKALLDAVTAVRGTSQMPVAVPFTSAYGEEMTAVSELLTKATSLLEGANEASLKNYLTFAARAFRDGSWSTADEAWSKIGASKYTLRVGPGPERDEVCGAKALFGMSFGFTSQTARTWLTKRDALETAKAGFTIPQFANRAMASGSSRRAQSAPWTNLDEDSDSRASTRRVAESIFCADTMKDFTDAPEPLLVSAAFHKDAPSMYFAEWLFDRKRIERDVANQAHVRSLFRNFDAIARGADQTAAMEFGFLFKASAITWNPSDMAANGIERGCYSVDFGKLPKALGLMSKTATKAHSDQTESERTHLARIAERLLRAPPRSFVYSIRFD